MAFLWGLDLQEMQWKKFKGSYMFSNVYYLRRAKMILYQVAMLSCIVADAVGTTAFSDYIDQQDGIQTRSHGYAHCNNNDIVGIASFNMFVGMLVSTVFGFAFFADLFWPERQESRNIRLAWKILSLLGSLMALAAAIALTVIVATSGVYITDPNGNRLPADEQQRYFAENGPPAALYRHNSYAVTSTVFQWPGTIAAFASTYLMWKSHMHDDQFGPFSSSRSRVTEEKDSIDMQTQKITELKADIPPPAPTPPQTYPST